MAWCCSRTPTPTRWSASFRLWPEARILWAHAGFDAPGRVRWMLRRHPRLGCDLAFRSDHASGGQAEEARRADGLLWHLGGRWELRFDVEADGVRHCSELDEGRLHADGERILRRLDMGAQQAADLAAFLRTLSSPALPPPQPAAVVQCRPGGTSGAAGSLPSFGGVSAGTRKRSLAQAPRSTLRQRSLQNGRQGLPGPYTAGCRQVGHGTVRVFSALTAMRRLRRRAPSRSWRPPQPRAGAPRRRAS
jgi:hypothetical protein